MKAIVLRRLPFERPHELMRLYLQMPPRSPGEAPLDMLWSFPKYEALREYQDVFSALATFRRYDYTLTGVDIPERISGEVVGTEYFDLLGVRLQISIGIRFPLSEVCPVVLVVSSRPEESTDAPVAPGRVDTGHISKEYL